MWYILICLPVRHHLSESYRNIAIVGSRRSRSAQLFQKGQECYVWSGLINERVLQMYEQYRPAVPSCQSFIYRSFDRARRLLTQILLSNLSPSHRFCWDLILYWWSLYYRYQLLTFCFVKMVIGVAQRCCSWEEPIAIPILYLLRLIIHLGGLPYHQLWIHWAIRKYCLLGLVAVLLQRELVLQLALSHDRCRLEAARASQRAFLYRTAFHSNVDADADAARCYLHHLYILFPTILFLAMTLWLFILLLWSSVAEH